jgi:hypothetical protein
MEVENRVFKTPVYILRATRKYAKNNREKINAVRKRTNFIRRVKSIIENDKMDDFERHFRITISKNYEIFEDDPEVVELMKQLNID